MTGQRCFSLLLLLALLSACTTLPTHLPAKEVKAYRVSEGPSLLSRFTPIFLIEEYKKSFNLLGTPRARLLADGAEQIFVDSDQGTVYTEARHFKTERGQFTNLLYRIHFEKVPWSLIPFHIGMGRNVGLFIIVTLNDKAQPVLYTLVHSCGCYLAFVPTSFMPAASFPHGWGVRRQTVFGESLPGLLDFQGRELGDTQLMVLIRTGSHRVKDVWLAKRGSLLEYEQAVAKTAAMTSLLMLPLGQQSTSFYDIGGARAGYVKDSHKPWERWLMGWWAFDWRIGEDKMLGKNKLEGPVFYTSLKPWARQESDLRNFSGLLSYWGWKL